MPAAPEPDRWLHPDVEVHPSSIAGDGLFARAPIAAATVVSRLGGRVVAWPELQGVLRLAAQQPEHPYIDTITVTDTLHLVLPRGRPNGKGNHSCEPNLWWVDAYTLTARRDIDVDEELTNDYATSTASAEFSMDCRCRSALCRGVVTGNDWQLAELRQRYGEHWVPALTKLIDERDVVGTRAERPKANGSYNAVIRIMSTPRVTIDKFRGTAIPPLHLTRQSGRIHCCVERSGSTVIDTRHESTGSADRREDGLLNAVLAATAEAPEVPDN